MFTAEYISVKFAAALSVITDFIAVFIMRCHQIFPLRRLILYGASDELQKWCWAQTKMWGEWRICCWSPAATDGRPVLPLQSLGIFLSTGYASGRCWEQRMHKHARICKWDVNMHSVHVAIECVTACISPHGPVCAASWPRLFGLQVVADIRGTEASFTGLKSAIDMFVFTHFCLVFHLSDISVIIKCLAVTNVSCSEPQASKFKYSWVFNVHCICITYLHWIFVQLSDN